MFRSVTRTKELAIRLNTTGATLSVPPIFPSDKSFNRDAFFDEEELASKHGSIVVKCSRRSQRRASQDSSVDRADEVVGKQWVILPECTGVWWKTV